jgi:hypothetical protein
VLYKEGVWDGMVLAIDVEAEVAFDTIVAD